MSEEIISKTKFFKDVKIVRRVFDWESIKDYVNEYLESSTVSDEKYECTHAKSDRDCIEVLLKRVGENLYNDGFIDEDFDSDQGWDDFCVETAKALGVRLFGVPYWYYPK